MSKSLTKRGYGISKDDSKIDIDDIKESLTVKPHSVYDDNSNGQFKVFLESSKKIYVPKYWGLSKFGVPNEDKIQIPQEIEAKFTGSLRDYQLEPVRKFIECCKDSKKRGGILQLPPGWGKTVMALNIISKLKVKTLIIVHKEFLMTQWKERIQQYLGNVSIGIIKQNVIENDNDIVIASLQSISMKDYGEEVFKGFGLVAIDECFPFNTRIHTDQGLIAIGTLYENWNINKDPSKLPKIYSFNQEKKTFELKQLTYAWRKERNELVKVTFADRTISCTPEHKILTTNGYVEAKNLTTDSLIISKYDNSNIHTRILPITSDYGLLEVKSIEYYTNTDNYVFDIEVQDNHNFVIGDKSSHIDGPVVSNCHHMGAQVFSRALFKVNFKYSLGLSATVSRKDGLSKVFKWFLGDIVYKAKAKQSDDVNVLIKYFYESDPEYSHIPLMYNGKPNISKLINQVCSYGPRTQMLVDELEKVLDKEPDREVIILSDRRNHLQEIESCLNSKGFKNIGYYVGGMKQSDLKESEKQNILLGTYNMVSEGFDLPKLNTLVLASPKSDVEQSVGRIQRQLKEDRKYTPLILDIVDQFSLFNNQGVKRKTFYKKKGYSIDEIDKLENKVVLPRMAFVE